MVVLLNWTVARTGRDVVSDPLFDGDVVATVDLLDTLAVAEDVDGGHGLDAHLVSKLAQRVHVHVDEVVVLVSSGHVLEHGPKVGAVAAPFDREETHDRFGLLVLQVELKLAG